MENKTKLSTRIAIWIIAIVMLGGTLLTYIVMFVASGNPDTNATQIAYDKYMKEQQEKYDEWLKQTQAACPKGNRSDSQAVLDGYKAEPFTLDGNDLNIETLQEGEGDPIASNQCIDVNYKGWNTSGQIFDSGDLAFIPDEAGLIIGWTEGIPGLRVGGIYKLIIPADKAYGETGGNSDLIPPNEPLTFIVEIISAI